MKRITAGRLIAGVAATATALSLAACSGGAPDEDPVTLTYWTWAPGIPDIVETWNADHPDIQVKVEQPAGADDILAKVLSAQRAGNGPDMFAAEYQKVPNFVLAGAGYDITDLVADSRDQFTDATWGLVTVGDTVYGVPQDTGPMVLLYRGDIFDEHGWTAPATWDDYAALAEQVQAELPGTYLGGYPDDGSTLAGYAMPLGAQWWSTDGDSWSVDIDGPETQRVAEFWNDLVSRGLADTTHFFTPEWNTELNSGTLLSWGAGIWSAGTIASVAPDTAGDWRIAPLPSWDGETTAGLMGGSSAMVGSTTTHAKEAVEFLTWLNGSQEGSSALAASGLFPASIAGQESLNSLDVPEMVAGQDDYWQIAQQVAADSATFTWGPNVQLAFDTYSNNVQAAVQNGTPFVDALTAAQDAVVADLKKTGYTVK
ncbi:MAG: extracellular solute-binding protein [Actinomycetales bacterium]|nr:extracellular solute-binding protein [Actinomycetales bacterium]